jgi:hypothetical protein
MELPSIASQMPVWFKNGACWKRLEGRCKICGMTIQASRFTGRLSRLIEAVVTVEAVGVCLQCRMVTRFHYRLHDDMRISGMTDKGWATWPARPSLFDRLRRALQRAKF